MQRPLLASLILSQNGDNVPISVKDVMVSKRGLGKSGEWGPTHCENSLSQNTLYPVSLWCFNKG